MSLEDFYQHCGIPKHLPRRIVKGRKLRMATAVIRTVRAYDVERDGYCRLSSATALVGPCEGESEWAHLEEHRRFNTRGQAPQQRHTTAGTAMFCTRHHQDYDAHSIGIQPTNEVKGADGTLKVSTDSGSVLV